jgi:hypothetical protein
MKYLGVYAYICIVRSIFFAHAVVDLADVAGASVSGFSFTFIFVFVFRLLLCYV